SRTFGLGMYNKRRKALFLLITIQLLFLIVDVLLGGLLMAEGFAIHINKGYVYFAMAFGLVLELCHIQLKNKQRRTIQRIRPMHQPPVVYGAR
ncbi:hypothetical protein R8N46_25445, partial [Vibrio sp. 1874]|uniref:hypothetical protein n=1 Tax=Vibrio sp. 1874 TaxID=3074582 RepID=UPI0029667D06